jgi:hypothetical protein
MTRLTYLTLFLCLAGPAASAQEKPTHDVKPTLEPQSELVELFGRVENRLREIDRLLSDAGAGDTRALEKVGPSGIDELLKQGRAGSEQAIKDIDRILELARQMGQQSQSSQSGPGSQQQPGPGQSGKDPLDGQEGNTTQRESTPSKPEQQGQKPEDGQDGQGGQKPKDQKGQQPGEKPGDQGDPKDPMANRRDPKNRTSGPPQQGGKDAAANPSDTRDRWGDLPVHARDVFRNEGGRDMPVQYRDWIDEYYKRLNKQGP